jgi:tape measure domain-containing protein
VPDIKVHITAENEGFVEKLQQVVNAIKGAKESSEKSSQAVGGFSSKLANLGMIVTGAYAGLSMLKTVIDGTVGSILKYNANLENNEAAFEVFLGSTELAKQYLGDLKKIAADTPFDLPGVTDAGKKLLAFGFDAETSLKMLRSIGDASAGLGLGTEGIQRITLALGQIKAKGRVMGDELLQLTEAGIPAQQILADKLHLTADQMKNIGDASIDADTAISALMEGMDEKFGGMSQKMADRMLGLLSTIKDNFMSMGGFILNPLFQSLETGLTKVRNWSNQFADAINGQGGVPEDTGVLLTIVKIQLGIEKAKDLFVEFTELFGAYDDDGKFYFSEEALASFDKASQLLSEIIDGLGRVGSLIVALGPTAGEITSRIGEWLEGIIAVADAVVNFLKGGVDKANGSFGATKVIIDVIVDTLMSFFIIEKIITMVQGMCAAFKLVRTAIVGVQAAIKAASVAQVALNVLTGAMAGPAGVAAALAVSAVAVGAGYALDKSGVFDFSSVKSTHDDSAEQSKLQKLLDDLKNKGARQDYAGPKPNSMQGQANAKDSQEALKVLQSQLKDFLDQQIQAYKDSLEKLSIQYKQDNISWQEYSQAEAQNKVDTEQTYIDNINQQIEAVNNTVYKTQQEKDMALQKLNIELGKHTNALQKATEAQQDVATVIAGYSQHVQGVSDQMRADANGMVPTGRELPQGSTPEEAALYNAYQNLKDTDKTGKLTYDLVLGMAEQESSRRQWNDDGSVKTSDDGGIGLMQLTSEYARSLADNANPWDLQSNANGGVRYLIELLNQYGNTHTALARYNGSGPAAEAYAGSVEGHAAELLSRATELLNAPKIQEMRAAKSDLGNNVVNAGQQIIDSGKTYDDFVCTQFVVKSWDAAGLEDGLKKAGIATTDTVGNDMRDWVPALMDVAKRVGAWVDGSSGYTPKAGDGIVVNKDNHVIMATGNGNEYMSSSGHYDDGTPKPIQKYADYQQSYGTPTGFVDFNKMAKAAGVDVLSGFQAPTVNSELGLKANEKAKENEKRLDATNKAFLELINDISSIPIKEAIQASQEKINKYKAEGNTDAVGKEQIVLHAKELDLESNQAKKNLEIGMRTVKDNADDMYDKLAAGFYEVGDITEDYINYINVSNYGPKIQEQLKKLEEISQEAASMGYTELAQSIKKTIDGVKKDLHSMLDKFRQAVKERATWQNNMIDSDFWMTTGQKSRAKQQVNSWEYQQDQDTYQKEVDQGWKDYVAAKQDLEEKLKTVKTDEERSNLIKPRENNKQNILAEIDKNQHQVKYLDQLKQIPQLLDKIRMSAKQALEDGLLTFLTEGITQANSLGEAFKNLANTILKAMQKAFAEDIRDNLMDKWYPKKDGLKKQMTVADADKTIDKANGLSKVTTDMDSFMVTFSNQTFEFANRTKTFFDNIAQTMQSAISLIPATAGENSSGSSTAGSSYDFTWNGFSALQKHADGGLITGAGTGTSDSILSRLSHGEFVINAVSVKKYGLETLARINNGTFANMRVRLPAFAKGGAVGRTGSQTAGNGMAAFTADLGTQVSSPVRIENYVDGQRVFDTYGRSLIRSEVQKENIKNAKLYSQVYRRMK